MIASLTLWICEAQRVEIIAIRALICQHDKRPEPELSNGAQDTTAKNC